MFMQCFDTYGCIPTGGKEAAVWLAGQLQLYIHKLMFALSWNHRII